MPIAIQCPACRARLKAPDQLAGKKVKCSKCGQGIAVPANSPAPAAPARKPAAKAAPARPQKAAPPVRLPLLSFEELKVPAGLRRSIEKEVGDEEMVWLGRPTPQSLRSKAWLGMWVGLVLSILTIVGTVVGLMFTQDTTIMLVAGGIGGLVLLTMGLPMATMPIWVRWLINYRDCYVLTPTRAIVFDNEKIFWATAKPYTADQLGGRSLQIKANGTGSIVFGTETIDLGLREKRRTKDREGPRGEKVRVTTITTKHERADKPVGFIDVDEVEKVEAMMRQVLKLGPPAAKDVA